MQLFEMNNVVLEFSNKPEKLLNGLTTNTLDAKRNAFIDIFGRIVLLADQYKRDENTILLIFPAQFEQRLLTHIDKYLKMTKVHIKKLPMHVYFNTTDDYFPEQGDIVIKQEKGQLVLSEKELSRGLSDTQSQDAFTTFRVCHCLPLQGIDFDQEMILNIGAEQFVTYISTTKGCFLGQEIVARVTARASPPRKLVVKYEDECTEDEQKKMTSKVSEDGRVKGFVFETFSFQSIQ